MKTIPCTIQPLTCHGEDSWIISIPASAVENAAEVFSELLTGIRKQVVFLHRKTAFTISADSAIYNGRQIPITKDFLECLEKLFSGSIRPGYSHIDEDFSDKHGNVCITVQITP